MGLHTEHPSTSTLQLPFSMRAKNRDLASSRVSTPARRRCSVPRSLFGAVVIGVALGALLVPAAAQGQSLRGSPASVDLQNRVARDHDFTFLKTPDEVRRFVAQGYLVPVRGNRDFTLHAVSFPYARPEVVTFIERLGSQYRVACGEQLVVTSLTRPTSRQPQNASARSVHPTGMALDLRYPRDRKCREWLEGVLLSLERGGVLDATLERYPLHYHVALFPRQYAAYVDNQIQPGTTRLGDRMAYTIQRGDSLWEIARQHGTTVDAIRSVNGINGNRIFVGQVIALPLGD